MRSNDVLMENCPKIRSMCGNANSHVNVKLKIYTVTIVYKIPQDVCHKTNCVLLFTNFTYIYQPLVLTFLL